MTHDPLCEDKECTCPRNYNVQERGHLRKLDCECELIARVRDDEQQQVARRLTAYHAKGCIGGTSNLGCGCGLWTDVLTYSVEQS